MHPRIYVNVPRFLQTLQMEKKFIYKIVQLAKKNCYLYSNSDSNGLLKDNVNKTIEKKAQ